MRHIPDIQSHILLIMQMVNIADVITVLEEIGETLLNWFPNNKMKLDTDKCHLVLNTQEPNTINIGNLHINNSINKKLLGITFDCKLNGEVARLTLYMGTTKKYVLMNAFFKSQFNYCPLVWMC